MKIHALIVSDDVRDIADDAGLDTPADVGMWLTEFETEIREAMEYAGQETIRRLLALHTAQDKGLI